MEQAENSTKIAGVDISKKKLDAVILETEEYRTYPNEKTDFSDFIVWLQQHGITRVGLEATGGYEHDVRLALIRCGFEVVVHQPGEVKSFAKFKRVHHKNDRSDAMLIAMATQHSDRRGTDYNAALDELQGMMTYYEHLTQHLILSKTFAEQAADGAVSKWNADLIQELEQKKDDVEKQLVSKLRDNPVLAERYELLQSIPGIGKLIALSLVVRVPELGSLRKGQAASLLGVAPFDHDSGQYKGQRRIKGGRARPREHLYLAALGAIRTRKAPFKAFAQRLQDKGKARKQAIVAVMRKLIETANQILKEKRCWSPEYEPRPINPAP